MKKVLLILLLTIATYATNAQSALDKISKETCEELSKIDLKAPNVNIENELGIIMIKLYSKYEKELKKEGIIFDFSSEDGGEEFGRKIGMNMVKFCPDALMAIAGQVGDSDSEEEEIVFNSEGVIRGISGEELRVVSIKDNEGKTQKFIWLTNFEGSDNLIDLGKKSEGKSVKVYYTNIEIFSPKLEEYIVRKTIRKIEFLD